MLLRFSHIQKDDSLIPLLPYAAGCFLASLLLTISGIAETHPQALVLATYLIQFGWLLLQIQGSSLVQKFGTQSQCIALFNLWLVMMQLLDVHRRNLRSFTSGMMGDSFDALEGEPNYSIKNGSTESRLGRNFSSGFVGQEKGKTTATNVRAFYRSMVCGALPAACGISSISLGHKSKLSSTTDSIDYTSTMTMEAGSMSGMREMEYLVLFELGAGLFTSILMFAVWLVMNLRQGGNKPKTVQKLLIQWQQINRRIKGLRNDWRLLKSDTNITIERI
ncbi:hypothetical protein BGZ76_011175 [Entomortierella beljakovae]|nr:hypothetical protein BGZ76_011175 [Entomortierella beljakovae]